MTRVRGPRRGLSELDEVDLEAQYVDVVLQGVLKSGVGLLKVCVELLDEVLGAALGDIYTL